MKKSAFKTILTEDRESKNINLARKYVKSRGYNDERTQKIIDTVRANIDNSRVAQCKFLLGVTRLYLDGQLSDAGSIFTLNKLLPYIGSGIHVKEYDNNLNGLSLDDIENRFSTIQQQDSEDSRKRSYEKEHTANAIYKIVRIPDFNTAKKYSQYTEWCVTKTKQNYDTYTYDGAGLFYFCLRDDFKSVPREVGPNCPLDEYGLSMIAVSVDEYGDPHTITSRWNHKNGSSDHAMSKDEVEELLGINFYETFKPFTEEELKAKGVLTISMAIKRLANGEDIAKIFGKDNIEPLKGSDGLYRCIYKSKSAIYNPKTNKITYNKWLDYIDYFNNGFARIGVNGRGWSFINRDGQLIENGKLWFDLVYDFVEGFAHVFKNDKGVSFINRDGQLIGNGNAWFIEAYNFHEGFAGIRVEDKGWSFINTNGQVIGNGQMWFDLVDDFDDGFAAVEIKGKGWSFINTNGQLIGDGQMWFDKTYGFNEGFARVYVEDKGYLIDGEGNFYDTKTKKPIPSPLATKNESHFKRSNMALNENMIKRIVSSVIIENIRRK